MGAGSPETSRKEQIDGVLLKLPGVVAKKINQLDAYFVSDRMFACISGKGVGLRLPAGPASAPTALQLLLRPRIQRWWMWCASRCTRRGRRRRSGWPRVDVN